MHLKPGFLLALPLLVLLLTTSTTLAAVLQHDHSQRIPSVHTSAVLARRILQLTPHGTLSTTFPASSSPAHLSSVPIGLPDYVAACDRADASNPTLLAVAIATSFRNALAGGGNISLSLQWQPPAPSSIKNPFLRQPAALPRFALLGYLERIPPRELADGALQHCFVDVHPDARAWTPGSGIHKSEWVRLVVDAVYWIGGFGDRAYIGWIPVEEWRGVTEEEIKRAKLPGEREDDVMVGWAKWLFGWREEL
ncbi:hypothetical protein GP486_008488 [Trichoglossum hirsutum]|uniref:CREG-like beta-barrel domain-containing protein n=1 Tax=Trichoglossum hirsutum TaxID=265104 RepID=A0A9P8IHG3_9PEZI|nr:hypothetical protein GP486_008488 [Trichoglossum hirsutum]